eukprot:SM000064S19718  [mRNA]  locus=s64:124107:125362:+ [translate_table: standard]
MTVPALLSRSLLAQPLHGHLVRGPELSNGSSLRTSPSSLCPIAPRASSGEATRRGSQSTSQRTRRSVLLSAAGAGWLLASSILPLDSEAQVGQEAAPVELKLRLPAPVEQKNEYIKELLKRSIEKKPQRDQERLDDYNRRNFGDYFNFIAGSLANKKNLTDNERNILEWVKKNR